jgi:hypothetical protein
VREGDGDQGFEKANELSWTVFENTRDLLGDLLGAKNAGVTTAGRRRVVTEGLCHDASR